MIGLMVPSVHAEEVPGWVKNTAGWWADDFVDDKQFLESIKYLIKEGVIYVEVDPFIDKIEEFSIFHSGSKIRVTGSSHTFAPDEDVKVKLVYPNGFVQTRGDNFASSSVITNWKDNPLLRFETNFVFRTEPDDGTYTVTVTVDRRGVDDYVTNPKNFYFKDGKFTTSGVPEWIKNNAKWWSEEKITNDDFMQGIKHLISNGMILSSTEIIELNTTHKQTSKNPVNISNTYELSSNDIKPDFYVFTNEKMQLFWDGKRGDRIELIGKVSDPNYQDFDSKSILNKDRTVFFQLRPGEYFLEINGEKDRFFVSSGGHTSILLKTMNEFGQIACYGMFLDLNNCHSLKTTVAPKEPDFHSKMMAYNSVKSIQNNDYERNYDFEYYNYVIPQWHDYSYGYGDYSSDYNYQYEYDTDVKWLMDRTDYYANEWLNDLDVYANQWVRGEITYDEYESKGFSSYDYHSNSLNSDFDYYWNSKYPYP